VHPRKPLLRELELDASGLCGNFLGQVIHCRPQAAVHDDGIGPLPRELKCQQQVLAVVPDRRLPSHRKPGVLEPLGDVAEIGVDDFACQHLVAGANDFYPHATSPMLR